MPSIRMRDGLNNPDVHIAEVQSESQWKVFISKIQEGLNVVVHDDYYWHRYKGIKNMSIIHI